MGVIMHFKNKLYLLRVVNKKKLKGTAGMLFYGEHDGIVVDDKKLVCWTLELPYLDNKNNISCIPCNEYKIAPYTSEKYKDVYQVMNVPNRTSILIHTGNYLKDTQGCILIGSNVKGNRITKEIELLESKKAMEKLKTIIKENNIEDLVILDKVKKKVEGLDGYMEIQRELEY